MLGFNMIKKGFTLLEVMIAIALFAGAMVPILLALSKGLFATTYLEHRQIASRLALNEMEQQEHEAARRWDRLRNRGRATIADFPSYEREVIRSYPEDPDRDLKEIRVTVYWTDQAENSVTLVTYFANNPDGSP